MSSVLMMAETRDGMMGCLMAETKAKSLDMQKAAMTVYSMVETRAELIYLATHWAETWASLTLKDAVMAVNLALKRWKDSLTDLMKAEMMAWMSASLTPKDAR